MQGSCRRFASALVVLLLMTLAACGAPAAESPQGDQEPPAAEPEELDTVRIGWTPSFLFLPIQIADHLGLFAEHGIDVELISFSGGAEVTSAMVSGSVDMAATTAERPVILANEGFKAMNVMALQNGLAFALIVRSDLDIQDVEELRDRKVGVTRPGSGTHHALRNLLVSAGLTPDEDVAIIGVGGVDSQVAALRAKQIDAMMTFEPAIGIAQSQDLAKPLVDFRLGEGPAEVRNSTFTSLQASEAYIEQNEDVVRRVVQAIAEAQRQARENPQVAVDAAASLFPELDQEVLRTALAAETQLYHGAITTEMFEGVRAGVEGGEGVTFEKTTALQFQDDWE